MRIIIEIDDAAPPRIQVTGAAPGLAAAGDVPVFDAGPAPGVPGMPQEAAPGGGDDAVAAGDAPTTLG